MIIPSISYFCNIKIILNYVHILSCKEIRKLFLIKDPTRTDFLSPRREIRDKRLKPVGLIQTQWIDFNFSPKWKSEQLRGKRGKAMFGSNYSFSLWKQDLIQEKSRINNINGHMPSHIFQLEHSDGYYYSTLGVRLPPGLAQPFSRFPIFCIYLYFWASWRINIEFPSLYLTKNTFI